MKTAADYLVNAIAGVSVIALIAGLFIFLDRRGRDDSEG